MKLFNIDIYSAKVRLFTDIKEYNKFINYENNEHKFVTYSHGSDVCMLVSNLWDSATEPKFLQCLSHECNHAAMAILESVGVPIGYEHQEALCYLQDHIFKRCYIHCLKTMPH